MLRSTSRRRMSYVRTKETPSARGRNRDWGTGEGFVGRAEDERAAALRLLRGMGSDEVPMLRFQTVARGVLVDVTDCGAHLILVVDENRPFSPRPCGRAASISVGLLPKWMNAF